MLCEWLLICLNDRIGGDRRMKDERETKEKLLASAEHEFMEKGYQGASLRNICKNAILSFVVRMD